MIRIVGEHGPETVTLSAGAMVWPIGWPQWITTAGSVLDGGGSLTLVMEIGDDDGPDLDPVPART